MANPVVQAQDPPRPARWCGCLRQMPPNMLEAAGKSGLYSFVAGTLLSAGNVTLGVYSAIGSAVASAIDSLIRPLINLCFSRADRRDLWGAYFWTKAIVSSLIVGSLCGIVALSSGIYLQIGAIASFAAQLFLTLFSFLGVQRTDYRQAEVYTLLFV